MSVDEKNFITNVEHELYTVTQDAAYSVAQIVGQELDMRDIGTQEWRNDVYLSLEANFDSFISDVLWDAGIPKDAA